MFLKVWPNGLTDLIDVLKAAKLMLLDTQVSRAVDGTGGGLYTPTAPIKITSAAGGGIGDSDLVGFLSMASGATIGAAGGALVRFFVGSFLDLAVNDTPVPDDNSDIDPAAGQIRQCATPTAQRDHHLTASGNRGRWVLIIRGAAGGSPIILHRPGSAGAIATLPANVWAFAFIYDDGANWRLGMTSGTPGADA